MRSTTKWLWLAMFTIAALGGTSARAEGEYWVPLYNKLARYVNERAAIVNQPGVGTLSPNTQVNGGHLNVMRQKLIDLAESHYYHGATSSEFALTYVIDTTHNSLIPDDWGNPVTRNSVFEKAGLPSKNAFTHIPANYGPVVYSRSFGDPVLWEHFDEIYRVASELRYPALRYDLSTYNDDMILESDDMARVAGKVIDTWIQVFGEDYQVDIYHVHAAALRNRILNHSIDPGETVASADINLMRALLEHVAEVIHWRGQNNQNDSGFKELNGWFQPDGFQGFVTPSGYFGAGILTANHPSVRRNYLPENDYRPEGGWSGDGYTNGGGWGGRLQSGDRIIYIHLEEIEETVDEFQQNGLWLDKGALSYSYSDVTNRYAEGINEAFENPHPSCAPTEDVDLDPSISQPGDGSLWGFVQETGIVEYQPCNVYELTASVVGGTGTITFSMPSSASPFEGERMESVGDGGVLADIYGRTSIPITQTSWSGTINFIMNDSSLGLVLSAATELCPEPLEGEPEECVLDESGYGSSSISDGALGIDTRYGHVLGSVRILTEECFDNDDDQVVDETKVSSIIQNFATPLTPPHVYGKVRDLPDEDKFEYTPPGTVPVSDLTAWSDIEPTVITTKDFEPIPDSRNQGLAESEPQGISQAGRLETEIGQNLHGLPVHVVTLGYSNAGSAPQVRYYLSTGNTHLPHTGLGITTSESGTFWNYSGDTRVISVTDVPNYNTQMLYRFVNILRPTGRVVTFMMDPVDGTFFPVGTDQGNQGSYELHYHLVGDPANDPIRYFQLVFTPSNPTAGDSVVSHLYKDPTDSHHTIPHGALVSTAIGGTVDSGWSGSPGGGIADRPPVPVYIWPHLTEMQTPLHHIDFDYTTSLEGVVELSSIKFRQRVAPAQDLVRIDLTESEGRVDTVRKYLMWNSAWREIDSIIYTSHTDTSYSFNSKGATFSGNLGLTGSRTVTSTMSEPGKGSFTTKSTYQSVNGVSNLVAVGEQTAAGYYETSTFAYQVYSPTPYRSAARVVSMTMADGSFQNLSYDDKGRKVRVDSWGNRYRTFEYGDPEGEDDGVDDPSIQPGVPRLELEFLDGQEVARIYRAYRPDGSETQFVCVTAGAERDDPENMKTVTKRSGGRVVSVEYPNGTMELYDYTNGITIYNGEPNASKTAIVDGYKKTRLFTAAGIFSSEATIDIASNTVLVSRTVADVDEFYRPIRYDYPDGTYQIYTYDGPDVVAMRERDGSVQEYVNDAHGRPYIEKYPFNGGFIQMRTNRSITGETLDKTRIGTDGSEIQISATTYNERGLVTSETDALNRVTTHTYSDDYRTRTTTLPDLTTIIASMRPDQKPAYTGGTAAYPIRYEHGVESNMEVTTIYFQDAEGGEERWTKTYTDLASRVVRTVAADGAETLYEYNNKGQLIKETDPDGITTLYAYNGKGEAIETVLDVDQDGVIDYDGTDRISRTIVDYTGGMQRTRSWIWDQEGVDSLLLVSTSLRDPQGQYAESTSFGLTSTVVSSFIAPGEKVVTSTSPDGSTTVSESKDGALRRSVSKDANGVVLSESTNFYDGHGRLDYSVDSRNGTTSYTYDDNDRVVTVTSPDPGDGGDPQVITSHYDSRDRVVQVDLPDGGHTYTEYYPTGEVKKIWGTRTFPTEMTYDRGQMVTMSTWQDFSGDLGKAVTTNHYGETTGYLNGITMPDGKQMSYTYTDAGRLQTSTSYRNIVTTSSYFPTGEVQAVTFSDGTPGISYSYNRRGLTSGLEDATGVQAFSYTDSGLLTDAAYSSGLMSGVSMHSAYDSLLRRQASEFRIGGVPKRTHTTTYDDASRVKSITDGTHTATYGYSALNSLLESVSIDRGGNPVMATSMAYDKLNRLETRSTTVAGSTIASFAPSYDDADKTVRVDLADGSYWSYSYDELGQLTSGIHFDSADNPLPGQSFAYSYDDIGNRTSTTRDGQNQTYASNSVNQIPTRTVAGIHHIAGSANAAASVWVNGQATSRNGEYFHAAVSVDNSTDASYTDIEILGVIPDAGPSGEDLAISTSGQVFIAETPELYSYDEDGNLLADGRWTYEWDARNQLIAMETASGLAALGVPRRRLEYVYDYMGRRRAKTTYSWSDFSSSFVLNSRTRFVYDGMDLIAELNDSDEVLRAYTWGIDLSGAPSGAGGAGGLLFATVGGDSYAAISDFRGNVTNLVDTLTLDIAATYEYDPYGQLIRSTGSIADVFPIRFSSRYQDLETGLLYYGLRYYQPETGRWLNRDPLGYSGGLNLYAFLGNDPINDVDVYGLNSFSNWDYVTGIFSDEYEHDGEKSYGQELTAGISITSNTLTFGLTDRFDITDSEQYQGGAYTGTRVLATIGRELFLGAIGGVALKAGKALSLGRNAAWGRRLMTAGRVMETIDIARDGYDVYTGIQAIRNGETLSGLFQVALSSVGLRGANFRAAGELLGAAGRGAKKVAGLGIDAFALGVYGASKATGAVAGSVRSLAFRSASYVTEKAYRGLANILPVGTKLDGAMFWSSEFRAITPANMLRAQHIAKMVGRKTVEMTLGGKLLNKFNPFNLVGRNGSRGLLSEKQASGIWDIISKRFAEGASGSTLSYVKGTSAATTPGKTYWRLERKILELNKRVTEIIDIYD